LGGSSERRRRTAPRPDIENGDLFCVSKNSFIISLLERQSRSVMLAKISSRQAHTVVNAGRRASHENTNRLPPQWRCEHTATRRVR
jgi:hypothetical protein